MKSNPEEELPMLRTLLSYTDRPSTMSRVKYNLFFYYPALFALALIFTGCLLVADSRISLAFVIGAILLSLPGSIGVVLLNARERRKKKVG